MAASCHCLCPVVHPKTLGICTGISETQVMIGGFLVIMCSACAKAAKEAT